MANKFQEVFPNGCFVRAMRDGEMWAGIVTTHTSDMQGRANGLIVRFSDGSSDEFSYSLIDLNNPSNSLVVYQFNGGIENNV